MAGLGGYEASNGVSKKCLGMRAFNCEQLNNSGVGIGEAKKLSGIRSFDWLTYKLTPSCSLATTFRRALSFPFIRPFVFLTLSVDSERVLVSNLILASSKELSCGGGVVSELSGVGVEELGSGRMFGSEATVVTRVSSSESSISRFLGRGPFTCLVGDLLLLLLPLSRLSDSLFA